jgi:hypothetical protein
MDAQGAPEVSRLVSEPLVRPGDLRKSRLGARRPAKAAPAAASAVRKPRGFRS